MHARVPFKDHVSITLHARNTHLSNYLILIITIYKRISISWPLSILIALCELFVVNGHWKKWRKRKESNVSHEICPTP